MVELEVACVLDSRGQPRPRCSYHLLATSYYLNFQVLAQAVVLALAEVLALALALAVVLVLALALALALVQVPALAVALALALVSLEKEEKQEEEKGIVRHPLHHLNPLEAASHLVDSCPHL